LSREKVAKRFWRRGKLCILRLFLKCRSRKEKGIHAMVFQFIAEQWVLVSILVVLVLLFMFTENRRAGKSISAQMLGQLVNKDDAVIVDIRDSKEFRGGHIAGSINIPYANWQSRQSELDKYKDKPVVLVCKMGQSAGTVAKMLNKAGFEQVYRLSGGLTEWQGSQMPVVKG
jgi:rhodanese-related sulfurtransferase